MVKEVDIVNMDKNKIAPLLFLPSLFHLFLTISLYFCDQVIFVKLDPGPNKIK
jgi:hypothetical protein